MRSRATSRLASRRRFAAHCRIAEAEAALRIDPALPHAHFVLGTAYSMKGQGQESRRAFLRALELNPSGGGVMTNFSIAEMQYGRLEDAVHLGRRAFVLSGKRGFYHLVLPMLILRADAECRVLLAEVERRSPPAARVQMLLAMLDVLEDRVDTAVKRSNAVVEREQQNLEMRFHRADVAYLLDAPDLEAHLAPLIEQSPTNRLWGGESVRMRYAYALRKRGEYARSTAWRPRPNGLPASGSKLETTRRRSASSSRPRRRCAARQPRRFSGSKSRSRPATASTDFSSALRSSGRCGPTRGSAPCSSGCAATSRRSANARARAGCSRSSRSSLRRRLGG